MAQTERARLALARPDLLREQAYIAGVWHAAGDDAVIEVTNPATGRIIGTVPDLGRAETDQAITAAAVSLPAWRARTAADRGRVLRRWFDLMLAHADDLARLLTLEQGKPLAEARGEIAYAASFIDWFAEEGRRIYGETIPPHRSDLRLLVSRQPIGVVAAITPWNFPAAMITRKAAPALAAGCTMVLKPSDLTPFSALALAVLAEEAGVPPGVFNVVTGQAAPIGAVLAGDPRVGKLTFTGSTAVGKHLTAACAPTLKRVSMELGGNAPFIVFDDADLDAAIEGALLSKFRGSGQTCVCANRILVQDSIFDAFAERLTERVRALRLGDGLAGPSDQGPLIDARAVAKVERHIADALAQGARLLTGGQRSSLGGGFFEPTVLADVTQQMLVAREEVFGPVAPLLRFTSEAQAIAMANDSRAGLAAYAYTSDLGRSWRVSEALEYGMVGLNTGLISTEVAPFGGMKESGLGREGSHLGIHEYLDVKYTCVGGIAAGG